MTKLYLGDIAVSEKTFDKLLKSSNDSNVDIWGAYPISKIDLWDQNFVNGKYIIAYELNPYLHEKLKSMLPKVRFQIIVDLILPLIIIENKFRQ